MSKKHNTPASSHDKNLNKVEESLSETHLYHGPIPAPHTLEKFNKIIPDGADRIMKLAENEQHHKIKVHSNILEMRKSCIRNEHIEVLVGQICAFILCASALIGGIVLVLNGFTAAGFALSGVSLAGVLKTIITRGKK